MLDTAPKTPAQCTVDKIAGLVGGGGGYWRVTVWSPLKPLLTRVYTISARSDNIAALQGLARFEEEHATPPPPMVS